MGLSFLALGLAIGVCLGFPLGLWVYSHVYEAFKARIEEAAARRSALQVQQVRMREMRVREAKNQLMQRYGPTVPKEHEDVMNEEIERVLGQAGRNGD